ncbi:MAG: hypothetical protein ACTHKU_12825, partial [Verrucomicrobiota bacterium]
SAFGESGTRAVTPVAFNSSLRQPAEGPGAWHWAERHTLLALGLMAITAASTTFWVVILRREVRKQTARLLESETKFHSLVETAKAALAEESSLLETLLANSPDFIYFKDRQSRFVRVSRSVALKFGVADPGEMVAKTDFDFFLRDHAQAAFDDELEIMRL